MDTQTRHALKQDSFVEATKQQVGWINSHRPQVIRLSVIAAAVLIVLIAGLIFWNTKQEAASTALGAAIETFSAPLAAAGAPAQPGTYSSAADRAKAANAKFVDVAKNYGWLSAGAKAHYFAGVTYQELGQSASAESELKQAAGSMDRNTANLASLALAGLYRQTGRDAQAIDVYNALISKPSDTVPAYTAQLALADLDAATGKQDQARQIWAKVKDADKTGAAGSIAGQKLTAK